MSRSNPTKNNEIITEEMVNLKRIYTPEPPRVKVNHSIKTSFNEGVEINFEDIGHDYTYLGKPLQGVTEYIKKFFAPFKVKTISKMLSIKWGVPQYVIESIWYSSGEVASDFGTAIHKALEHYEKYKDIGEMISKSRGEVDNYALPKHPILRKIVLDFIEVNKIEGIVECEALVSNVAGGICGLADRIVIVDMPNKICRIGDYKINIDADIKDSKHRVLEPFNYLPNTKLSKYQLQLSVYANMLQKSGWTVQALDVYVLEDKWKYYELEVLQVL